MLMLRKLKRLLKGKKEKMKFTAMAMSALLSVILVHNNNPYIGESGICWARAGKEMVAMGFPLAMQRNCSDKVVKALLLQHNTCVNAARFTGTNEEVNEVMHMLEELTSI